MIKRRILDTHKLKVYKVLNFMHRIKILSVPIHIQLEFKMFRGEQKRSNTNQIYSFVTKLKIATPGA